MASEPMKPSVPAEADGAAPKCGGKNRKGAPCGNAPGYKTDHPGSGNCTFHGGSSPNGKKHATDQAARKAVETYGLPRDISPTEALLEEVRYSAGHVAWLREKVREIEDKDLVWGMTEQADIQASEFGGINTTFGAKANVWLELYYRERKHLVDVTKAAISAGIEERRVKLAEAQGQIVAEVFRRVFARMDLTAEQSAAAPLIVSEELRRAAAQAGLN
jgi:hypothetical protein